LIAAFAFLAALILIVARPLGWDQWIAGLATGLAWLIVWYASIPLWVGIFAALTAIVLLIAITRLASHRLRSGDHPQEMDSYHPFRSQEAKDTYLGFYNKYAERWPVESETMMVDTSFGQTFIRVSGPSDGFPLVLLPGDSVNSLAWIPQIADFSAVYRTYAVDHVFDNGRSVYSRPMKKPADFVAWLDDLFTGLELESIHFVAHSYGGWQASLYALAHPERLNRLVLLAPAATVLPPNLEVLLRGMIYFFIPTTGILRRYLHWNYPDSARTSDATREILETMITEAQLSKKCFKPRNFVAPTTLTDDEWQDLRVPTLFITAENEVFYPAQKALRRLESVAPHVKTLFTTDAGHDVAIVKPEWVNQEVFNFLAEF
jgi:pimeloyl-ACP methyl ester carboxylesterase